jgi:hypothetical protein
LKVEVEGIQRVRIVRVEERDGMLVAETSPLEDEDPPTVVVPEAARQAALIALEAFARQLVLDPTVGRALILPHLKALPASVQQQVLEADDPAQWVRALATALTNAPAGGAPRR